MKELAAYFWVALASVVAGVVGGWFVCERAMLGDPVTVQPVELWESPLTRDVPRETVERPVRVIREVETVERVVHHFDWEPRLFLPQPDDPDIEPERLLLGVWIVPRAPWGGEAGIALKPEGDLDVRFRAHPRPRMALLPRAQIGGYLADGHVHGRASLDVLRYDRAYLTLAGGHLRGGYAEVGVTVPLWDRP